MKDSLSNMKKIFCLFLLVLFSFCTSKKESRLPRITFPKQKNVIQVNTKEMLHIEFLHEFGVSFDKDIDFSGKEPIGNKDDYQIFEKYDTILPKYKFSLIVDTSYTISGKRFEYKNIKIPVVKYPDKKHLLVDGMIDGKIPTKEQLKVVESMMEAFNKSRSEYSDKTFKRWNDYVECYPLLLYNNDSRMGYINEIKFIQEAKDADGKWKPIEFFEDLPRCVGHDHFYKFETKKYLGHLIMKYHGNFKTKLRVKMKIRNHYYYSNEFTGFINHSQFNLDYLRDYFKFNRTTWDDRSFDEYSRYVLLQEKP